METSPFNGRVSLHSLCPVGQHRGYRRRGERFVDACVDERDRFGGGFVMDWGGIAHGVKSHLIVVKGNMTAVWYRDAILRPVAVPLVQQRWLILQQNNARPHVAKVCRIFWQTIHPLDWQSIQSRFVPHRAFMGRSGQRDKEAPEIPNHHRTIRKC